jgi:hypothetical protein
VIIGLRTEESLPLTIRIGQAIIGRLNLVRQAPSCFFLLDVASSSQP